MKNFIIGMYGKYDDIKFNRDFRENFYGIEACPFGWLLKFDDILLKFR